MFGHVFVIHPGRGHDESGMNEIKRPGRIVQSDRLLIVHLFWVEQHNLLERESKAARSFSKKGETG